jgi:hypothetical protein
MERVPAGLDHASGPPASRCPPSAQRENGNQCSSNHVMAALRKCGHDESTTSLHVYCVGLDDDGSDCGV